MFNRLLVAVDGSRPALRALDSAVEIAQRFGASICLLHAFPHVSDMLGTPVYEKLIEARSMSGRALLESARAQVGDRAPCEVQLIEGPPAQAIVRVAEEEQIDLIVIGSRGHSQLGGLLLGSVSNMVAQRAKCPVLIVH